MSVQTELTRISTAKTNIKNVVNSNTANTITNQKLDAFPPLINGTIAAQKGYIPWLKGEGNNFNLKNSRTGKLDKFELYGNTTQGDLPSGYTQVDYIQSSGTQYIDTGINADTNLRVVLDIAYVDPTLSNQNIGAINLTTSPYSRYHLLAQQNYFKIYLNDSATTIASWDVNRHTFDLNIPEGKVIFDNNTTITVASSIANTQLNFWLFGRNSTSTKYYSKIKQWGCKMYYSNVLVRDFIPCYRNSDSKVGLYDLVNGIFYTNQGTGAFTYGTLAPTPDAPVDIRVVKGNNTIKVTGKNLLDQSLIAQTESVSGVTASIENGYLKLTGTPTSANVTITNNLDIANAIKNGTTTFKCNIQSGTYPYTFRIYEKDENDTVINRFTNLEKTVIYVPNHTYFLRAYVPSGATLVNLNCLLALQIETGSSATTYEPYKEQTYPISLKSKNLLPFPYTESTHTYNGVTFTVNSDGSVLVNGTATGGNANTKLYGNYQEANNISFPGKYLSGGTNNVRIRAINNTNNSYTVLAMDTGSGAEIDTTIYKKGYIELTVLEGTTVNNILIKPMVLNSLNDTSYETYYDYKLCKAGNYKDEIKKSTGKNLFDLQEYPFVTKVAYNANGEQVTWSSYSGIKKYFPVKGNTTYSFSNNINYDIYYGLVYYDEQKNIISNVVSHTTTFTTPVNCKYIRFAIHTETLPTWVQIEQNSQVTDYEPYGKVWYIKKNINKIILNNTPVYAVQNNQSSVDGTSANGSYSILKSSINSNLLNNNMYCSFAKYEYKSTITDNSTAQSNLSDNTFCIRQGTNDRVYFKNSSFTGKTGTQITSEINGKELYYTSTVPEYETITNETLINQLNVIETFEGINNISIENENNVLPDMLMITKNKDSYNNWKTKEGLN